MRPRVDHAPDRNYRYYMDPIELKVARIGNSRGVRIPAPTLARYHIGTRVVMEERADGILLRPRAHEQRKLSWEETAQEMSATLEEWEAWDVAAGDGLDEVPWAPRTPTPHRTGRRRVTKPQPKDTTRHSRKAR